MSPIGPALGAFDACLVRDLGLPTIGTEPGLVGPGGADPSGTVASGDASGPVSTQKFQLGETLPVVPARIVRRILRGEFVDMAELSEEHLELELRRALEGEEGRTLPPHKLRPVPDILAWVRSFCHFAGIVVKAHPDKEVDLWAYQTVMLSGGDRGDWWRTYVSRFRQQWSSLEKAQFGRLDQALHTKAILSAGVQTSTHPPLPSPESSGQPKGKKRKGMVCFAWNDGRVCASVPCRYQHMCSRCGGDHRKLACTPVSEGQPLPAASQ